MWGVGDGLPLCEELPNGADAVCGVQGRGNTSSTRHRLRKVGGRRPHHCANQPHGAVCVVGTTSTLDTQMPSGTQNGGGYPERRNGIGFSQHKQHMLGDDPAVNVARLRVMRVAIATVGQLEAHERHTKVKRKENARQRKRERQQNQRGASAQVATHLNQWCAVAQPHDKVDHQQPIEIAGEPEALGLMGDDPMIPREVREHDGGQAMVAGMHPYGHARRQGRAIGKRRAHTYMRTTSGH